MKTYTYLTPKPILNCFMGLMILISCNIEQDNRKIKPLLEEKNNLPQKTTKKPKDYGLIAEKILAKAKQEATNASYNNDKVAYEEVFRRKFCELVHKKKINKNKLLVALEKIRKIDAKKLKKLVDPNFDTSKEFPENDFFNMSFIKKDQYSKWWFSKKYPCYKSRIEKDLENRDRLNFLNNTDRTKGKKYLKTLQLIRPITFGGSFLLDMSSFALFSLLIKDPWTPFSIIINMIFVIFLGFVAYLSYDCLIGKLKQKYDNFYKKGYAKHVDDKYNDTLLKDLAIAELKDRNTKNLKSKRQFIE